MKRVLDHQSFRKAELTTNFIAAHKEEIFLQAEIPPRILALAAALRSKLWQQKYATQPTSLSLPWQSGGYRRLNHLFVQHVLLSTPEGASYDVALHFENEGRIKVVYGKHTVIVKGLDVGDNTFESEVLQSEICIGA